jgi:hypothetical protein
MSDGDKNHSFRDVTSHSAANQRPGRPRRQRALSDLRTLREDLERDIEAAEASEYRRVSACAVAAGVDLSGVSDDDLTAALRGLKVSPRPTERVADRATTSDGAKAKGAVTNVG